MKSQAWYEGREPTKEYIEFFGYEPILRFSAVNDDEFDLFQIMHIEHRRIGDTEYINRPYFADVCGAIHDVRSVDPEEVTGRHGNLVVGTKVITFTDSGLVIFVDPDKGKINVFKTAETKEELADKTTFLSPEFPRDDNVSKAADISELRHDALERTNTECALDTIDLPTRNEPMRLYQTEIGYFLVRVAGRSNRYYKVRNQIEEENKKLRDQYLIDLSQELLPPELNSYAESIFELTKPVMLLDDRYARFEAIVKLIKEIFNDHKAPAVHINPDAVDEIAEHLKDEILKTKN